MKAAWIAVMMMIACETFAASDPIPPVTRQAIAANKNQDKPEAPKQSGDKPSIAVNVSVGGELSAAAENAQQKTNAEPSKWADPITLFTGLLFAVGMLQVWVYWKQKGVMEKALAATEKAANAAELAARSARNQSTIMGNQFDLLSEQKKHHEILFGSYRKSCKRC